MDDEFAFLILLVLAVLLTPAILAIVALVKVSRLQREMAELSALVAERLARRGGAAAQTVQPAPQSPPAVEQPPQPEPEREEEEPAEAEPEPEPEREPVERPAIPAAAAAAAPEEALATTGVAKQSLEERIASRWMVWLGAVTVALAGIFLVKYASDSGLLGPGVRVSLGVLLGLVLAVAGEWMRRDPRHGRYVGADGTYVAQALTASGVFIAFSSVYAAYALYALIPPLFAFVALAAVAFLAFALSLLQGSFIALLGIVGAYATPILVSTGSASAVNLFSYLFVIAAVSLALVRFRCWWWLSFATVAGSTAWVVLWFLAEYDTGDVLSVGLYLSGILALFLFFWRGISVEVPAGPWYTAVLRSGTYEQASWVGALAVALLFLVYMELSDYGTAAFVILGLACVICAVRASEAPRLEGLVAAYGVLVLCVLAGWRGPVPEPAAEDFPPAGGPRVLGEIVGSQLGSYLTVAGAFAALFGLGCLFAASRARRTALWAGVAVAMPIAILVLSYFRASHFAHDINWSLVALALAGLFMAPVRWFYARREEGTSNDALGLYAAGVVAAIGIALAIILERALLTVALSAMLPALAWIDERLKVPLLRWVAGVLAVIVLVRLTLNWNVFDYPIGRDLGANWVLYGYGIPALAFFVAQRWFAREREDRLTLLLEAGALLFFTLFVTLEIRTLVEARLDAQNYSLLEASLQTLSWLVIAESRMRACLRQRRLVPLWGGRILLVLALANLVLVHLLAANPAVTHDPVGSWPIFNLLLVAYLLPAIALVVIVRRLDGIGFGGLSQVVLGLGFVLVFAYVTLEVQRFFQGPVLSGEPKSSAEVYAYSAAWLALAGVLLVLGIRSGAKGLRYGALVALLATVCKVFLYDMADLTGLWRVASFLGLGLCLIAIGYVYRRFVFPVAPRDASDGPEAPPQEEGGTA